MRVRFVVVVVLALVFAGTGASAQILGGAITGVVKDDQGGVASGRAGERARRRTRPTGSRPTPPATVYC